MKKQNALIIFGITALVSVSLAVWAQENKVVVPDTNITVVHKEKPIDFSAISDTKDWLTCRSEKYGYEFKYPKGWYISDLGYVPKPEQDTNTLCSGSLSASVSPFEDRTLDSSPVAINFFVETPEQAMKSQGVDNIFDYYALFKKRNKSSMMGVLEENTVDGETVMSIGYLSSKEGIEWRGVDFFHKGSFFIINFNAIPLDFQKLFFSTFHFVD